MFLIDKVKEAEFNKGESTELDHLLNNAICVNAQDVCDYFYSNGKEEWNPLIDFPSPRPPFPLLWIEWKLSPSLLKKEDQDSSHPVTSGFLLETKENQVTLNLWRLGIEGLSRVMVLFRYRFDKSGEIITELTPKGRTGIELAALAPEHEAFVSQHSQQLVTLLAVPLLTLSFMNCKNIEAVVERESPTKLNIKRQRAGKLPITKIYTLKIDGVRRLINNYSGGTNKGFKNALHLCRGHFKDFSHGRGLFGKLVGRYWWGSVLRGSEENGKVIKDYQVRVKC